jgi:hypothetical protein
MHLLRKKRNLFGMHGVLKFSYDNYIRFLFNIIFFCSFLLHQFATKLVFFAALLIVFSDIFRNKTKFTFEGSVFFYISMSVILFLYGFFIGVINGNSWEFIFLEIKVLFIYPALMFFLVGSWLRVFCLKRFISLVILISYAVILMISISIFEYFYSLKLFSNDFRSGNLLYFSYYIDRYVISSLNLFSLFSLVPILFVIFQNGYFRKLSGLALLFSFALILISGRTAFIGLTLILIFIYLLYIFLFKLSKSSKFLIFFFVLFPLCIISISLNEFFNLKSDFTFFKSQEARIYQLHLFYSEFLDNPFGKGLGSISIDSRSLEYTSIFELEWAKKLVDIGFLFILHQFIFYSYFSILVYRSFKGRFSNVGSFECSTIAAFIIIFLASLTNPYLSNLDSMMIVLFILGAYDYFRVHSSKRYNDGWVVERMV